MSPEHQQIEAAIAALTAQRAVLGDAVVDLAVAPLLARLAAIDPTGHEANEQTLRQVTVLFLDVVGSTALSQHLDPEDIHALLDGALERCTAIVESHRGKVLQYAGDSLLAVFGADRASEDDAECAVRAGLALVDEGRRQGAAVKRLYGHADFNVRVGAHTGPVLLGGGLDIDGRIRGIAVNIAARMEQTAPAGALRISRDTYRQVRDLFDVEPQPPLAVKGIDEPVASVLVLRQKPRSFRPPVHDADGRPADAVGRAARLIGREPEMEKLTALFDEADVGRSLRLVTVVADAGVGKSRLLREVEVRLERTPTAIATFHGRAQRHGLQVPYGVIRDLLAWHCDIVDSDGPEVACAKLVGAFGQPFGPRAEEQAAVVGQLIGLDFSGSPHIAGILQDGRQIRTRAFHAIEQFLRLRCAAGSGFVVLLLDDLHWADDGSLDLVDYLASTCADLPIVIGCFTRPALLERRPAWGRVARGLRIELEPLSVECSGVLVEALLAPMADPPAALRDLILRSADGNPFHMEELLGMLIDDGVVLTTGDGWTVDEARLTKLRVPPTLTAVLQARLDALPPREKLALQRDSVIGHVFWDEALRTIAPESIDALPLLAERKLIDRRQASAFVGVREYAFKHHLLHQVTYDTVLKAPRRELHKRTADWLVSITAERIGEHLGLIADHYERAGDVRNATRYLQRAADAAFRAAAFGATIDYAGRALAGCAEDDLETRFDLLDLRTNAFNSTGRRKEQAESAMLQEALAERLDDDGCRAKVGRWRSLLAVLHGDYAEAIAAADRACALSRPDDPATRLGALLDKAQALIYLGDSAAAEGTLRAMLPITRSSGNAYLEVVAMNRLSTIAKMRGDYVAARDLLERALDAARSSGNRRFEGALMGNIADFECEIGNHAKARSLVEAGLGVIRSIGDRGSEGYALHVLAMVTEAEGDPGTALRLALQGRDIAREVGDTGCESICVLTAGTCHAALGDGRAAEACFDAYEGRAGQSSRARGEQASMPERAELALAEGRLADALAIVAEIVAWLDQRPADTVDRLDVRRHWACHRVFAAAADPRASPHLDRAEALLAGYAATMLDDDCAAFLGVALHRQIAAASRRSEAKGGKGDAVLHAAPTVELRAGMAQ